MAPTTFDPSSRSRYGRRLALVAVSGAVYTLAALWWNQVMGEWMLSGRLISDGEGPAVVVTGFMMAFTTVPFTGLAAWQVRKWAKDPWLSTWSYVWRWCLGVFGLWLVWWVMGDIGLITFLAFWAAYAALVTPRRAPWGKAVAKATDKAGAASHSRPSRRRNRGGTRGTFGRIPKETEVLLKELVHQVTGTVVRALPVDAPVAFRRATVRLVLETVLQTWWSDHRVDPLDAIDVDRLKSAVRLAADLAVAGEEAERLGIFRGVLRGLLGGWRLRRL